MIMDKLYRAALKSPVCLGLDTKEVFLPATLKTKDWSLGEKYTAFNKAVIDATEDIVACYKLQIACYEALGLDGLTAYRDTLAYLKQKGKIAIGDAKRGDISSTAELYAKGHFTGDFEVDLLTVNAYMGEDAVSPYYPYLTENNKGLFVLLHTSNQSARDFQEQAMQNGEKLYETVADAINRWGEATRGEEGFSAIGAVVGLTYPEAFLKLLQRLPHTFFLVPGYGAQGGTGKDIAAIFKQSRCAVVNSSRGLIGAHSGICEDNGFVHIVREKTLAMKEDIFKWL